MDKEIANFGTYIDRTCDGMTRRDLIKVGSCSFLGLGLTEFLALKANADAPDKPKSKGQDRDISVILLWLAGGATWIPLTPSPMLPLQFAARSRLSIPKSPGCEFRSICRNWQSRRTN